MESRDFIESAEVKRAWCSTGNIKTLFSNNVDKRAVQAIPLGSSGCHCFICVNCKHVTSNGNYGEVACYKNKAR